MTGATERQLQWWDEHGYVRPARRYGAKRGPGFARRYSDEDVQAVKIMLKFKATGLSASHAAVVAKMTPPNFRGWIVVDGLNRVHHCVNNQAKMECVLGVDQPTRVVEL